MTEISPAASVTLDGNGSGQVMLAPPSGTVWRLRLASVSTTGTVKQPQAFLYRGSTSGPLEQIDSTYLGNSASSGKVAGAPFFAGQVLWAKWAGGDAGATATLQAYGQQGTRGEGSPFDSAAVGEGFPLSVATVFQAGNTVVINSAGEFIYNGTPASGNLVASIAPAAGTDPYGNAYGAGVAQYVTIGGNTYVLTMGAQNGIPSFFIQNHASAPALAAFLGGVADAAGAELTLDSGAGPVTSTASDITLQDSANSGVSNGKIQASAGQVLLGVTGNLVWNDNAQQFQLPASGGPFIANESFHTISNSAGFTGTLRVKLLPWNAVWISGDLTWSGTAGGTFTFGSLPSASYYPVNAIRRPVGHTGVPSSVQAPPRLFVPAGSGAVQLVLPTVTAANSQVGVDIMYPTN